MDYGMNVGQGCCKARPRGLILEFEKRLRLGGFLSLAGYYYLNYLTKSLLRMIKGPMLCNVSRIGESEVLRRFRAFIKLP